MSKELREEALRYATQVASLVKSFSNFTRKLENPEEATNEFTKELDNITNQKKRDNLVQLLKQGLDEIQKTRGSEKSNSKDPNPPDEDTEESKETIKEMHSLGYSIDEIAETMKVDKKTVRKHLKS